MMDLELIEPHPRRVLEAFRQGEFDGLEIIGRADEKAFFELRFRERLLEALAEAMPTARQKEEVPRWFILAANLSLRLHGEHAFLAWERVVRCGGLLNALDPALASKHLDPQSGEVLLHCAGFDEKNAYDRQTPCHQDINLRDQHLVIYHQHAYAQLPLVSFTREVLELEPAARRKALTQIRRLERSFLTPLQNLPPP